MAKISESIKTGRATTSFNPHNISNAAVRLIYHKLLSGLVNDKELIDILGANASKFRHRFHYETNVYNTEGQRICTITDLGRKTIQEYIQSYQNNSNLTPGRILGSPDGIKAIQIANSLDLPSGMVKLSSGQHTIGRLETRAVFVKGQTTLQ